jgi:hypothetical protein
MDLKVLGLNQEVCLMTDFMLNKPVDMVIGPDLVAEDLSDTNLGRCLNTLYARGMIEIFAKVTTRTLRT